MPVKAPMYLKPGRTKKGKKTVRLRDILSGDMISPPLGDFRHLAHVGSSGGMGEGAAAFGDLSFLWSERPAAGDDKDPDAERRRTGPPQSAEARRGPERATRLPAGSVCQAVCGRSCAPPGIPSPVLRNALVLPYTGPEQALVLPGVSPYCHEWPRRRPEQDTGGGDAGDGARGGNGGARRATAPRSPIPTRPASSPRASRLPGPDAKGPCTSPGPKRGLLQSIKDQVQNITLSPPLSRNRNFPSARAFESASSRDPLLLRGGDAARGAEEEEEASSRAFRFMSISGNGLSHRRFTASSGKLQQPKATTVAARPLGPGPEPVSPLLPSQEGWFRNGFASAADHEQPGCLWPRNPESGAVTESMHFLRSGRTLHQRSKRRDLLGKSRREVGDEQQPASAECPSAACPADDHPPGARSAASPPAPSPSVSPPPPTQQRSQTADLQERSQRADLRARGGEWATFGTLSRPQRSPGDPYGGGGLRPGSADSLLSLHTDLGPSMLDDVLGVMERHDGRRPRRASRYAAPGGALGKAAAANGCPERGDRGLERDSGVACEASASAENLLRHFSLK